MAPDAQEAGLLDTSVVLDLGTLDPQSLPPKIAVSAITMAELAAGPAATNDPHERARRQHHLQVAEAMFDPIPFGLRTARAFGELCHHIFAMGRHPRRRMADLMIAATAMTAGLSLVTRNPDDFAGLDSLLEVVSVSDSPEIIAG